MAVVTESLRQLLEDGSKRLTDSLHMASNVPFVLETEKSDIIMNELKDKSSDMSLP